MGDTMLATLLLLFVPLVVDAEELDVCRFTGRSCEIGEDCNKIPANICRGATLDDGASSYIMACEGGLPVITLFTDGTCSGAGRPFNTFEGQCIALDGVNSSWIVTCPKNCFSGASLVNLKDGFVKQASEVLEGDFVESFDAKGHTTFSEVFLVQHKNDDSLQSLRRIEYESVSSKVAGALTISDLHLIRKAKDADKFVAAKDVTAGSSIFVKNRGDEEFVEARVSRVKMVRTNVRNIHTMNDRIVVDGVMVSSLTQVAPYSILQLALLPLKLFYRMGLSKFVTRIDELVHQLDQTYRLSQFLGRILSH